MSDDKIKAVIERLRSMMLHLEMTDLPPFPTAEARRQHVSDLLDITQAYTELRSPVKERNKIPPDPMEVTAYSAAIGYPMDGQAWCDHYAVKGWMIGSVRMKDWKAAVRLWKTNGWGQNGIVIKPTTASQRPGQSYDRFM